MFSIRSVAKSLLRTRQSISGRPSTARLRLEAFEERVVPATYVWQGIAGQGSAWVKPRLRFSRDLSDIVWSDELESQTSQAANPRHFANGSFSCTSSAQSHVPKRYPSTK